MVRAKCFRRNTRSSTVSSPCAILCPQIPEYNPQPCCPLHYQIHHRSPSLSEKSKASAAPPSRDATFCPAVHLVPLVLDDLAVQAWQVYCTNRR